MSTQFKLSAAAAAVSAVFAIAPAHATIYGAGASAIAGGLLSAIITDDCDQTQTVFLYDNNSTAPTKLAAGAVFELSCTPLTSGRFTGTNLSVSYDTTGGSWKAFTSTTPALLTAAQGGAGTLDLNPVKYPDTTNCAGFETLSTKLTNGSAVTVSYGYGCSLIAVNGSESVTFGLTDVETKLFTGSSANQPLQDGTWNTGATALVSPFAPGTELSQFPVQVFGVVFGVAASGKLWLDMQQDQITNNILPSSCTAGATTVESCMPIISREQYASIVTTTGAGLTKSAAGLFFATTAGNDYSLELARRDQGSGTQASSNAYFVNQGCSNTVSEAPDSLLLPVNTAQFTTGSLVTNTITYNASTSDVINRLQLFASNADGSVTSQPTPTSSYVIGVVSGEKYSASSITGTGAAGTSTAPWGFLRLEGAAPTTSNFNHGFYSYTSTEQFHCNPGSAGQELQLCSDLGGKTSGASSLLSYSGTGIYVLSTSSYKNGGKLCSGARHT